MNQRRAPFRGVILRCSSQTATLLASRPDRRRRPAHGGLEITADGFRRALQRIRHDSDRPRAPGRLEQPQDRNRRDEDPDRRRDDVTGDREGDATE